jgi:hypothetical protein
LSIEDNRVKKRQLFGIRVSGESEEVGLELVPLKEVFPENLDSLKMFAHTRIIVLLAALSEISGQLSASSSGSLSSSSS